MLVIFPRVNHKPVRLMMMMMIIIIIIIIAFLSPRGLTFTW